MDHILTNTVDIAWEHEQWILRTDFAAHNAIYHIAGNISLGNIKDSSQTILMYDMRRHSIEKFTTEI